MKLNMKLNLQTRRVKGFYREFAEKYDELASASYYKKVYDEITWRLIEPYLPESGLVLDAGGGTGRWAVPIAKTGLKVVVYDISREMLNVASRKAKEESLSHLISVHEGDIREIRFADDTFDFVLAEGDPISYCGDPERAGQELVRVLKPNSYISAGVDSVYSIAFSMLNTQNEDLERVETFLETKRMRIRDLGFDTWAFTPKDLTDLFSRFGLEVIKIAGKPVLFLGNPQAADLFKDVNKIRNLVEIELTLCEEPTLLGLGGHLHIVAKKPL